MESLEKLRQVRIEKLEKIRKLGINPYPSKFENREEVGEVREKKLGSEVRVAGRIMARREHGKIIFADLRDESGQIQLVLKQDSLVPSAYPLVPLLDIGDFLGVEGKLFETKAGELSIEVADLALLSKSLRPLPEKREGLKDIETRYRQRYLDLLMNPEVKKVFEVRSRIITAMRKFLDNRDYVEVETPFLQPLYGGGLARPFKTYHNALGIPLYLRISTELYLKRLIVGGFEKVYEIAKLFRNEGIDRQHNPEFTILETMEAYISYKENMELTEQMFEFVTKEITGGTVVGFQSQKIDLKVPWKRLTMVEAVESVTSVDFSKVNDFDEAKKEAKKLGVSLKDYVDSVGLVLASVFEEKVEPTLIQPTFIYDFPVETSPLAKRCSDDSRFVERFEHFVAGMEMSNNYSELNDPIELAERFKDERKKERLGDEEAHQTDEDFVEAIEYGMPPTSGLGPSIDRLVMILTDSPSIRDVILFPTMRPNLRVKISDQIEIVDEITSIKVEKGDDCLVIDKAVREKFPDIKVGVAVIEGVSVKRETKELENYKKEFLSQLKDLTTEEISEVPGVRAYRKLFKATGVDWHSRRPSVEALLRRIATGKGLYRVNNVVDAYNLAVLEGKISLGAFDLGKIALPKILRFAKEGEEIILLGESEPTVIHKGELIYADQKGPLTLDLNYRDCDRTKVTGKTKNILLVADGCEGISEAAVKNALDLGCQLITRFAGGKVLKKFVV